MSNQINFGEEERAILIGQLEERRAEAVQELAIGAEDILAIQAELGNLRRSQSGWCLVPCKPSTPSW